MVTLPTNFIRYLKISMTTENFWWNIIKTEVLPEPSIFIVPGLEFVYTCENHRKNFISLKKNREIMSGEPRKGTFKVEFLKDIEKKIQARWEENNAYEENAPEDMKQEKFMVTFQSYFTLIIRSIIEQPILKLRILIICTKIISILSK